MEFEFNKTDLASLSAAVARNPAKVLSETKNFFTRGLAAYNRIIIRNPWRMGMSGGGAPKDTGNLRDTHARVIDTWQARIYPTADYAPYVHGIQGWPRKRNYQLRPWLDYAYVQAEGEINNLQRDLLNNIVHNLAE
jgi:hypothetical protein